MRGMPLQCQGVWCAYVSLGRTVQMFEFRGKVVPV